MIYETLGWFVVVASLVVAWFLWRDRDPYLAPASVVREWARMPANSTRAQVAAFIRTGLEIAVAAEKAAPPFSDVTVREGVPFGTIYVDVVTRWPMSHERRMRATSRIAAAVEATGLHAWVRVVVTVRCAWEG